MTTILPNPAAASRLSAEACTPAASRQLDALELLALGYLLLPVLVFLLGWLKLPYGLLLAAAMLPACLLAWRKRHGGPSGLSRVELACIVTAAIAWVSLSGVGGVFHLNKDWLTRMSVLRDLVVGPWPASYGQQDDGDLILRCPLGYYLVPALVGKLTSLAGARAMLWAWTAAGTALFLLMAVAAVPARKRGSWGLVFLAVAFFSGMDIVGWFLQSGVPYDFARHIEWWGQTRQLSSNTTQLFWVPNHALPGWLAVMIAWRHRDGGLAAAPAALLLLGVIFWAPLVAVGAMPFLLWCVWQRQGWRGMASESLDWRLWVLLPVVLLMWRYLTMNVQGVGNDGAGAMELDLATQIVQVIRFDCLEWGFLALAVLAGGERKSPLLLIAIVELLLLPLASYGPGNDLVMRGGIPALVVLMMATISVLQTAQPLRRLAIVVMLMIGSVTAIQEFERAILPGDRYLHEQRDFVQVNGKPWHYMSGLTRPELALLFKQPQPMPQTAAGAPRQ